MVPTITDAGFSLFEEDGMNINYLAFRNDSGQFTTVEARRAFCQAVNVEEMVQSLYGDYAGVATSVMPLWMAPYDEAVTQTAYDPEAAKAAFEELGITEVSLYTYSNVRPYNSIGGTALAEAIQGYLQEVGVTVNISQYDWTTYQTKVETDSFDCCLYGWVGDNGDPDNFMNLLADTNVSMNVGRYSNDEYKALIQQGLATAEGEERDNIYLQCEQMVAEQMPWMVISHAKNLAGYNPRSRASTTTPRASSTCRASPSPPSEKNAALVDLNVTGTGRPARPVPCYAPAPRAARAKIERRDACSSTCSSASCLPSRCCWASRSSSF